MKRTSIPMSAALKAKAQRQAKREGVTLGHFVRKTVEAQLNHPKTKRCEPSEDSYLSDNYVDIDAGPSDVALNHDKYLAQTTNGQLDRDGHRKIKPARRVRR